MYKCDYGSWHFYHSCLHVNSGIMIDLKKKNNLFSHHLDVMDFQL